ncbi:MAG TPA: hypothetical protein VIK65_04370 [Candidatus Limnocylindrales bacterium]
MTGSNDRSCLPIHEDPERVAVTGENRVNGRANLEIDVRRPGSGKCCRDRTPVT